MSRIAKLQVEFTPKRTRGLYKPFLLYCTGGKTKEVQGESLEVIVDELLHQDRSRDMDVLRGTVKGKNTIFALKICYSEEAMLRLEIEARHYEQLNDLQGDVIPTCFGLFEGSMSGFPLKCLLLDYCGENLPGVFDILPLGDRYAPFFVTNHTYTNQMLVYQDEHSAQSTQVP
jgi:hypothetical protein